MAFEPLVKNRQLLICKLEGTPYTMETLASAQATIRVRTGIKVTRSIDDYAQKFATDDDDFEPGIKGMRHGKISFGLDLYKGSSLYAPPAYDTLLQGCGLQSIVYASTKGIGWSPIYSKAQTPITMWIQSPAAGLQAGLMEKFKGCMGNMKILVDKLGAPFRAEFEFDGVFYGVVGVSSGGSTYLSLTSPDTYASEGVIGTDLTWNAVKQKMTKMTLDIGNKIEMDEDAGDASGAGIAGFYVSERKPILEIDPTMVQLSDQDWYTAWSTGAAYAFGAHSTNLHVTAGKAQIMDNPMGDRGGKLTNAMKMLCSRDTSSGFPWELLIGTHS